MAQENGIFVGVGVYPTLSLINHSCEPNSVIIFDKDVATLRSIKDVKAGEQVGQFCNVGHP